MAKRRPTHAQVKLHLQLYDLRREARMRQAREWFVEKYSPTTPEEAQRLAPPGSQENAFLRMVLSYWEQACFLLNSGLLHEELFFLTANEFFFVWQRIEAGVSRIRQALKNPHMFEELEKAARRYEKWAERRAPGYLEAARQFMEGQKQAAAKAS